MLFKNSVRTSKRTPHFTITKINWLTLFNEIISVYSESHTKPINALWESCGSRYIQLPLDGNGLSQPSGHHKATYSAYRTQQVSGEMKDDANHGVKYCIEPPVTATGRLNSACGRPHASELCWLLYVGGPSDGPIFSLRLHRMSETEISKLFRSRHMCVPKILHLTANTTKCNALALNVIIEFSLLVDVLFPCRLSHFQMVWFVHARCAKCNVSPDGTRKLICAWRHMWS
jgi:hypothetical protein